MTGLPVEVAAALAHAGLRARTWRNVTTIRFPDFNRAAYRVELDAGGTIKARCLEDESAAQRAFEMRRALPAAFVPAFHCHGRVLLERWIDGDVMGTSPPDHVRLVEAAGLLASLHGAPVNRPAPARDDTSEWRARTEAGLDTLVRRALLAPDGCDALRADLARHDPRWMRVGVGHFDFCGENMVVDRGGRLHVFDNERVGIGSLGFDLARTWYRWALSPHGWATFLEAYCDAAGRDEQTTDALHFWTIVTIVHSACLRLDTGADRLAVPLARLRELAAASAAGPLR